MVSDDLNLNDAGFTVISGGQTGVDVAALLAAEACCIPYAGFVPLHYTNELGTFSIPERFRGCLMETSSVESAERTEKNIASADGILTISFVVQEQDEEGLEKVSKGTQHGIDYAIKLGKRREHLLFVFLPQSTSAGFELEAEVKRTLDWITSQAVTKCAIGGPRESEAPGIQAAAFSFLVALFKKLKKDEQDMV